MPRFLDNPVWFDNNGTEVKGYNGSNIDGAIAMWDNTAKTIVFANLFPSGSVILNTNDNALDANSWDKSGPIQLGNGPTVYVYKKK